MIIISYIISSSNTEKQEVHEGSLTMILKKEGYGGTGPLTIRNKRATKGLGHSTEFQQNM